MTNNGEMKMDNSRKDKEINKVCDHEWVEVPEFSNKEMRTSHGVPVCVTERKIYRCYYCGNYSYTMTTRDVDKREENEL